MSGAPVPKVTFGVIVLNGLPFLEYNLRALYPYAHQLIVVEGASRAAAGFARPDGHSSDGTLELLRAFAADDDPDGKLVVVTAEDEGHPDGFWPGEKDEQSRAYAARATGDYLWQVDVDEFYLPADMEAVLRRLGAEPRVAAASFRMLTFWGSPHVVCDGWYLRRGGDVYHRLFRWGPGFDYARHRPPTVLDEHGRDLREGTADGVWLDADATEQLGVHLLHYSLLFPRQVREKVEYYVNWDVDAAWFAEARRWMADSYLTLRRPFHVHNVYRYPSWLAEYAGEHPPEVLRMLRDVRVARRGEALAEERRGTRDVQCLLSSSWYAAARAAVEAAEPLGRRAGEQARRAGRVSRRAAAAARPALDAAGAVAACAPGAEKAEEFGRRGARRVRRSAARRSAAARERIAPGALILAYHRVASPAGDPQAMCVSPERFARHLEAIKAFGACVSLRDLVRRMAVAAVPRRTVVLTFDDGYADNLHAAEPLLRAAGVPATMFVSAGVLDDDGPFWWDELADLVLGEAVACAGSGGGDGGNGWDLRREDDPTPAHAEYRRLAGEMRTLSPADRDRVLAPLRARRGGRGKGPPVLSADEVGRLSSSPVVEIGSHALTHTLFTALDEAQIRAELVESRRRLQELTGHGCDLLSYPFGGDGDLPSVAPLAAHDCGYMAACANVPGTVWRRSDPYTLPRLLVRDWEPEELAERLERWAGGDVEGLW